MLLTILGLLTGDMIRPRRQCLRRHRRLAGLALPEAGDAQQVGVKAGPEVVPQIQDQPARRQIVLRKIWPEITAVQDAAEKRKIRLHPLPPGRRIALGVFMIGPRQGQGQADEGGGSENRRQDETHGLSKHPRRAASVNVDHLAERSSQDLPIQTQHLPA